MCGEGFQACLDRGCPHLQLASSSPAPRAWRCGQTEVSDQLTIEIHRSVATLASYELRRYTSETEVTPQFHRWCVTSAVDTIFVEDHRINRRVGSIAELSCRPYPLYVTEFHAATKDMIE